MEIHKRARQTVRPAAPRPPTPSLYEQETQLDALDLLLTGSETISEYRRSHFMRRRNTVQKRMATCGEGVDYLPTVCTSVRTYTAGQCLQTTIKQYNTHDNTCVLTPNGSCLNITTTIAKTSESAVRPNGLTAYETNTVNHVLDRLTDNTTTHTTSWKPYGTIARVHVMHDEPHVTIVRIEDAVVEEQPLVDVIDADMMRLGKRITKEPIARGRAKNRDRKITKKHSTQVRGSAPSRKRNSQIQNSGGGTPGQTTGRVESSRFSQ